MKAHLPQNPNMKKVEKVFNKQLNKAYASGMANGAKIFARVVRDKINSNDNKEAVIADITNFVDKTLENDIEELSKAFAEIQKRTAELLHTKEQKK